MVYDDFNRDENDEITDEQYFSEDDGRAVTADDEVQMTAEDEDAPQVRDNFEEEIYEDDYRVTSITENFLRVECQIKLESSKTPIKFKYRGEELKGIVLQKINDQNYVFLVKPIGKGAKRNAEKMMKKIFIPDAELI